MVEHSSQFGMSGRVFLEKIVASTNVRVERLKSTQKSQTLKEKALSIKKRSFEAAIRKSSPAIIAEVKRASPSKGVLRADLDPVQLAQSYEAGGAAAISVVTEPDFFQGNNGWLESIRSAVALPILRKDFILDDLQVIESAALGADAVLFIARLLSIDQMRNMLTTAMSVGLDVLFEAHDREDLERIAECFPKIVGINARDLDTFEVDTAQFERLRPHVPANAALIAESGIETHDHVVRGMRLGYQAFLVGESLVKSGDPQLTLRALRNGVQT